MYITWLCLAQHCASGLYWLQSPRLINQFQMFFCIKVFWTVRVPPSKLMQFKVVISRVQHFCRIRVVVPSYICAVYHSLLIWWQLISTLLSHQISWKTIKRIKKQLQKYVLIFVFHLDQGFMKNIFWKTNLRLSPFFILYVLIVSHILKSKLHIYYSIGSIKVELFDICFNFITLKNNKIQSKSHFYRFIPSKAIALYYSFLQSYTGWNQCPK